MIFNLFLIDYSYLYYYQLQQLCQVANFLVSYITVRHSQLIIISDIAMCHIMCGCCYCQRNCYYGINYCKNINILQTLPQTYVLICVFIIVCPLQSSVECTLNITFTIFLLKSECVLHS